MFKAKYPAFCAFGRLNSGCHVWGGKHVYPLCQLIHCPLYVWFLLAVWNKNDKEKKPRMASPYVKVEFLFSQGQESQRKHACVLENFPHLAIILHEDIHLIACCSVGENWHLLTGTQDFMLFSTTYLPLTHPSPIQHSSTELPRNSPSFLAHRSFDSIAPTLMHSSKGEWMGSTGISRAVPQSVFQRKHLFF